MSEYGKDIWKQMAVELANTLNSEDEQFINAFNLAKVIHMMELIEAEVDNLGTLRTYADEARKNDNTFVLELLETIKIYGGTE